MDTTEDDLGTRAMRAGKRAAAAVHAFAAASTDDDKSAAKKKMKAATKKLAIVTRELGILCKGMKEGQPETGADPGRLEAATDA